MADLFDDMPEHERSTLIERYLTRWRDKVSPAQPEKAKLHVQEDFVYMLRMFWQARFDKMDTASRDVFDWVSKNFLPETVRYKGVKNSQLLIEHPNHGQLAHQVFDEIWAQYEASPHSGFVLEEKQSFTSRLMGLFQR
jgi:hypothetical protein